MLSATRERYVGVTQQERLRLEPHDILFKKGLVSHSAINYLNKLLGFESLMSLQMRLRIIFHNQFFKKFKRLAQRHIPQPIYLKLKLSIFKSSSKNQFNRLVSA